jgi:hypothetical protein
MGFAILNTPRGPIGIQSGPKEDDMSKTIHIKVDPNDLPKKRNRVVTGKGGSMRDRRERRQKDAKNSWKKDWNE